MPECDALAPTHEAQHVLKAVEVQRRARSTSDVHGWCVAPDRAEGLEARGRRPRLGKERGQVRAQPQLRRVDGCVRAVRLCIREHVEQVAQWDHARLRGVHACARWIANAAIWRLDGTHGYARRRACRPQMRVVPQAHGRPLCQHPAQHAWMIALNVRPQDGGQFILGRLELIERGRWLGRCGLKVLRRESRRLKQRSRRERRRLGLGRLHQNIHVHTPVSRVSC